MRRVCTTLVVVSSLLVAATPANAKSTVGHRQQVNAGTAQMHVNAKRTDRRDAARLLHTYTYGRT